MSKKVELQTNAFLAGLDAAMTEDHVEAGKFVVEVGGQVLARAEEIVPRRTDRLAGALYEGPLEVTPGHVSVTVGVSGQIAPYAQFVEFGTQEHGAAQPFLEQALRGGGRALRAAGVKARVARPRRPRKSKWERQQALAHKGVGNG